MRTKVINQKEKLKNKFDDKFDFQVVSGDLHSAFEQYIANNKVDIIIMGTKGAQGLKNMFKGSNTSKLMLQTAIPILIIPEHVKHESIAKIVWASDFKPVTNLSSLALLKDIA
jgi:nucleotide-binding universal stress UspA family protein